MHGLERFTANALVPDHLLPYVLAVSGLQSMPCGPGLLHHADDTGVLVVFSERHEHTESRQKEIDEATAAALALPWLRNITVLAPARPAAAPQNASVHHDEYWALELPLRPPGQKLRNLLRRAARDVTVSQTSGQNAWTDEHAALAESLCRKKNISGGSEYIFNRLGQYLSSAPGTRLYSAFLDDGSIAACAIADFSPISTAFYMFAFRSPAAPPGSADLLLHAIAASAGERGHGFLNLGLGIDAGVAFFKKKWGAKAVMPLVETSWEIPRPAARSWFNKIFARNR